MLEDLNSLEEDPKSSQQLERLLHRRGINVRLMGRICTSVSNRCSLPCRRS
jgi:Translation initiation factor eIF3 subunit 135